MKNNNCYFHLMLGLLITLLYFNNNSNSFANESGFYSQTDSLFFYKVDIPINWNTTIANNDSSFLRIASINPSNDQAFFIYAFKAEEKIDLKSFSRKSDELFSELGQYLPEKGKFINKIVTPSKFIKTYKNTKYISKLYITSDYNFGYIILYKSSKDKFQYFDQITKSFKSNIPFKYKVTSWIKDSGILSWIVGIIMFLVGIGFLFLIGKSGQLVRKGINTKKELAKIKTAALLNGYNTNDKWDLYNRKSNLWIAVPLVSVIIFYAIMFLLTSLTVFLISLIGLAVFVLGFFNFILGPSADVDDYF